jgi:hypothetical protein
MSWGRTRSCKLFLYVTLPFPPHMRTFTKVYSLNSCRFGSAIVWKPTHLQVHVQWKRFKKRLPFPPTSEMRYSVQQFQRNEDELVGTWNQIYMMPFRASYWQQERFDDWNAVRAVREMRGQQSKDRGWQRHGSDKLNDKCITR